MFNSQIREYRIDLDQPAQRRWDEVLPDGRLLGLQLVKEAQQELRRIPEFLRWVFTQIYLRTGGQYGDELKAWAGALSSSPATATMLNCAYELSHVHIPKLFGCTTGMRWVEGEGMVHVRTLDWPLPSMGAATCLFNFTKGKRHFVAVGVPGQVGILSGMLPGAYSCTINWAPPDPRRIPTFDWGPTFLLRKVLEECDTYEQALKALQKTPLSTSVFFALCGSQRDQGCVIERTHRSAVVRPLQHGVIAQANHHVDARFAKNNSMVAHMENAQYLVDSTERAQLLEDGLRGLPVGIEPGKLLNFYPIRNADTVQMMTFWPTSGKVTASGRIGPDKQRITALPWLAKP